MPKRIPRPCRIRGCREIVEHPKRYCDPHYKEQNKKSHERKSSADVDQASKKFYGSQKWRDLRNWYIRQFPICVECGADAQMVDHIVPIKQGGPRFSQENLQSMCNSCHAQKRQRESIEARRANDLRVDN